MPEMVMPHIPRLFELGGGYEGMIRRNIVIQHAMETKLD
jgi:hypothetical protein